MRFSEPLLKRHPQPSPTLSEASSLSFGRRPRLIVRHAAQQEASSALHPARPRLERLARHQRQQTRAAREWTAAPPANAARPIAAPRKFSVEDCAIDFPMHTASRAPTAQAPRAAAGVHGQSARGGEAADQSGCLHTRRGSLCRGRHLGDVGRPRHLQGRTDGGGTRTPVARGGPHRTSWGAKKSAAERDGCANTPRLSVHPLTAWAHRFRYYYLTALLWYCETVIPERALGRSSAWTCLVHFLLACGRGCLLLPATQGTPR